MAKEYHGVDMNALASLSLGGDGGNFKKSTWWKAKKTGTAYEVRVLPPVGDMPSAAPWYEVRQHFNGFTNSGFEVPGKEPGEKTRRAIYSLAYHTGCEIEDDPMAVLEEYMDEQGDKETHKKVKAKSSWYMNIVYDDEIYCWGAPFTVAKALLGLMKGKTGDISHTKTGRPLEVTRFDSSPWYQVTPLDKEPLALEDWEEDAADFTKFVTLFTPDEIYAIMWENLRRFVPLTEIFPKVDFEEKHQALYRVSGAKESAPKKKAKVSRKPAAAKTTKKKGRTK